MNTNMTGFRGFFFKKRYALLLWSKVPSALEGIIVETSNCKLLTGVPFLDLRYMGYLPLSGNGVFVLYAIG